jgi:hypothetical protein
MTTLACGRMEKDPLKNYESISDARPPYEQKNDGKSTMTTLFFIDIVGDNTFVQGEEQEVKFKVRHTFSNPDNEVQYALRLKSEDALKGARFSLISKDLWSLKWQPAKNILSSAENSRKFDIQLQIQLLDESSPSVKKQFYGQEDTRDFTLVLQKDLDQPVFSKDINYIPAAAINPDQQLKIQFTVAAKGLTTADDLDVTLSRGPEAISSELVQLDAVIGVRSAHATRIKSLGVDKQGRSQFLYEIQFNARPFTDLVLQQIQSVPVLKEKYTSGVLNSAEALFYIEAVNKYSATRSIKTARFTVNLTDTAGYAIIAGSESTQLTAGAQIAEHFFVRASDSRSLTKVTALEFGSQKIELKDGQAEITEGSNSFKLTCTAGTPKLNEHFGCKAGSCYQSCRIEVKSDCNAAAANHLLKIHAKTEMGKKSESKALEFRAAIKGKSTFCQGAVTP